MISGGSGCRAAPGRRDRCDPDVTALAKTPLAGGQRGLLKWAVIAVLAGAAVWTIDHFVARDPAPVAQDWADSPFSAPGPPRDFARAVAATEVAIANARAAAAAASDQWLMHEILAGSYLARAQLTGSYDDYAAAARALDDGFKVAVKGSGPHLMRASLDFSMHRLAGAESQLDAVDRYVVPPEPGDRAEMLAMHGDIAFYRGQLPEALAFYDKADALVPGFASFRRAIFAARTGAVDRADAYFEQAEKAYRSPSKQTRSYLALQRGILDLDRGRLDDAMVHFRAANALFPGRWLIEEHIAEVLTLQGKTGEAEKLYRAIVARTGHPEFIDVLAGLAEKRGDSAEAQRLFARAWAIWERRLQQFAEATYGHAIDHCVAKRNWACAVRMAEQNVTARPYGDAKVALAGALLGSGRAAEARSVIEPVLASPWRTPQLHRTAADIYAALGLKAEAGAQDKLAKALNPLV
jgi:tetratricopeptide (TPR) repeat protein